MNLETVLGLSKKSQKLKIYVYVIDQGTIFTPYLFAGIVVGVDNEINMISVNMRSGVSLDVIKGLIEIEPKDSRKHNNEVIILSKLNDLFMTTSFGDYEWRARQLIKKFYKEEPEIFENYLKIAKNLC